MNQFFPEILGFKKNNSNAVSQKNCMFDADSFATIEYFITEVCN